MAIRIKSLQDTAKTYTDLGVLYKDLALDVSQRELKTVGFSKSIPTTEINTSINLEAIRNSLQNLFSTRPGQRFLFPEYGLDLNKFLFDIVNENNGQILGNLIFNTVNENEPRVTVTNVTVLLDPDNNQYVIDIFLIVPLLNIETTIRTTFDIQKQSFIVLPSSEKIL
jgi:phage baseplate assembly protein W